MKKYSFKAAESQVSGPAIALIVVAAFSGVLLILSMAFDIWLLGSGAAARLPQQRGMPAEIKISVRIGWTMLMLVAHVVIFAGAIRMKQLRSRGFAMVACILALVPCFGPCFVLGIPFGIWGLVALTDQTVKRAFEYQEQSASHEELYEDEYDD